MTVIERFFSLFTRIRPGEGLGILLLGINGFLLFCAYYILKPVRDSLILTEFDAETRNLATAVTAGILLFIVPLYGVLFRNTNRTQLVVVINVFFIVNLIIFYLMYTLGISIAFQYYVWFGIFGVMAIAQFWAYATDIYNVRSGQRVFPLILVIASVGALLGSKISAWVFPFIGTYGLMFVAGVMLAVSLFLYRPARHAAPEDSRCIECEFTKPKFEGLFGGFAVVLSDQYLRLIALFVVLLNWINSTGEYILSEMVINWADAQIAAGVTGLSKDALINQFYGNFNFYVTLLGLLLQTFLVARLLRWVGVPRSLLVLPILAAVGYALVAFIPIFTIIRVIKIAENGTDYSLMSTLRQALFLPTDRETKYEGKTAIDTFFWRFGDMIQYGAIFVGKEYFGFGIGQFALMNLGLALVWIGVALAIGRQYRHVVATNATSRPPELHKPISDVILTRGETLDICLDPDTFIDPDPGDVITLRAKLANGNPLPSWLRFHPKTRRFEGNPPTNMQPLEIRVTARDFEDLTARDHFIIRFAN